MYPHQHPQKYPPLDPEEAEEAALAAEAWRRGILSWKLYPYQLEMYEICWDLIERLRHQSAAADDYRIGTIVASRKMGKSFVETLISMEFGIRYPGSVIRITAPTAIEARSIFLPIFAQILQDCPHDVRPKQRGIDHDWYFPNGSMIVLRGASDPDTLRGPSSDLNWVDEAAYIVGKLMYVVNTILYPMTRHTRGATILCSTLNKNPNSEFNEFYRRCHSRGQAVKLPIYQAGLSEVEIEAERNAVDEITWRVEYECVEDRDENLTVVPEWTSEVAAALTLPAPLSIEHPQDLELAHWTRFTSADWGTVDNTVILTGYFDFAHTFVHITGEGLLRGAQVTAGAAAALIRRLEAQDDLERPIHASARRVRCGDHDIPLLQSIQVDERLVIQPAPKLATLEAMINVFRVWVSRGQLRIDPRCVNLLGCLEKASWKERASTRRDGTRERELERSQLLDSKRQPLGHFDALMAAVYLILLVEQHKRRNPLPQTFITGAQQQAFGPYHPEKYGQHVHGGLTPRAAAVAPAPTSLATSMPVGNNIPKWLLANTRRR